MVRSLLTLGKLIRATKQQFGGRFLHRVSYACDEEGEIILGKDDNKTTKNIEEIDWIPHPRNGIYFPKGHDWVMEDVPATAASPARTFWLRSVDGVESVDVDHRND